MRNFFRVVFSLLIGLQFFHAGDGSAQTEITAPVSEDIEVTVSRFDANGDYLLLWIAPEYGFRETHRSMARRLGAQGIEVWQSDIVEALFLPQGSGSLKRLDGGTIADLIEYAHRQTGKKIALAGDSYAAMAALLGARSWQDRKLADPYLVGAVLFTPYSYAYIPALGLEPEYMPIVESTNIPMMIYQAKNSGTTGGFAVLLDKLRLHESPVYTRIVPGVMSLFYAEPPSRAMIDVAEPIAIDIRRMLAVLARHQLPDAPVAIVKGTSIRSGIDIYLREFNGAIPPLAIKLTDIHGAPVVRNDFAGKVTVVNFWATWCPPCIEEIPSLNRLQRKMKGRPFELISINYAEDRETVMDFLRRVKVDFPVLLDTDGAYAKAWSVISYPSSFVIDPQGRIRYGVNAAIEWDDPELITKLESLMR